MVLPQVSTACVLRIYAFWSPEFEESWLPAELQGELKRNKDYGRCVPLYEWNGEWLTSLKSSHLLLRVPLRLYSVFLKAAAVAIELPRKRGKTASRRYSTPPCCSPVASLFSRTTLRHVSLDKLYTLPCCIWG